MVTNRPPAATRLDGQEPLAPKVRAHYTRRLPGGLARRGRGFLALGVAGMTSQDGQLVRGANLAMESIGWFVLVPLSLASLLTGLVQSLGTRWGLFRHYWVIVKLGINLAATIVLLLYMQTLSYLSDQAADTTLNDLSELGAHPPCSTPLPPCCSCWWPRRCPCSSREA